LLRIVGIQRDSSVNREFVLLQNQGSMRVMLRGHVLMADRSITTGNLTEHGHAFHEQEAIPSGMFVLLRSGAGEPKWGKTKEGQMVYHAFMDRQESVWPPSAGALHVLKTQHTFAERHLSDHASHDEPTEVGV